ncbi:MAG: hypothetical protein ABGZ17_29995, partial [Planctomycetaceae bacterium]
VVRNGLNAEVHLNGTPIASYLLSAYTSLTLNGLAGDDSLEVDYAAGDPLDTLPLTFNGDGDNDDVTVSNGAFTTITKTFTNASDGTIDLDGSTITYSGLEPVLLNVGTAADIIFNLPAGTNADVEIGNDVAIAGNSELRGSTFENTSFSNPANSLTVNMGNNGDTITVLDMDAAFNPTTAFILNGGTAADVFQVQSTQASGGGAYASGLTINAGDGNDTVNVGSNAPLSTGDLSQIVSNLIANGQDDLNQINISDEADTTGDTAALSASLLTGLSTGSIEYNDFAVLDLILGTGNDQLDITATHTTTTSISANDGNDTLTIAGDDLRGINDFDGNNGNDTFHVDIAAAATIDAATLAIDGGDPASDAGNPDTLVIDDAGGARTVKITYNDTLISDVTGLGFALFTAQTMEVLDYQGDATNDDAVTIVDTASAVDSQITPSTSSSAEYIRNGGVGGDPGPDITLSGLSALSLDGGDPVAAPGDTLTYDGSGTNSITGPGSGVISNSDPT